MLHVDILSKALEVVRWYISLKGITPDDLPLSGLVDAIKDDFTPPSQL